MNINSEYAVILCFHIFHFRGQTKVAYLKICYKTSSFICISTPVPYFETFSLLSSQRYIDMFYNTFLDKIYSSIHVEMSSLEITYILTFALYIREFKHRWYQIYKADYCFKHFKLVFPVPPSVFPDCSLTICQEIRSFLTVQIRVGLNFFFELRYSGPVKKLQNGLDKKNLKKKIEFFLPCLETCKKRMYEVA